MWWVSTRNNEDNGTRHSISMEFGYLTCFSFRTHSCGESLSIRQSPARLCQSTRKPMTAMAELLAITKTLHSVEIRKLKHSCHRTQHICMQTKCVRQSDDNTTQQTPLAFVGMPGNRRHLCCTEVLAMTKTLHSVGVLYTGSVKGCSIGVQPVQPTLLPEDTPYHSTLQWQGGIGVALVLQTRKGDG